MNPIQLRKQQLLAQSEITRGEMISDLTRLGTGIGSVGDRSQSLGLIVSSAATLVAGFFGHQKGNGSEVARKPGWGQSLLKGAGLICTLWLALRPAPNQRNSDKAK